MSVDPEQLVAERRATPRLERPRLDAANDAQPALSKERLLAIEHLARLRDGYSLADAERWLCVIRGDRKPATPADLAEAIADLAADEQQSVDAVRAGIDKKLQAEGSSLAAWTEHLSRPRKLLGRGATSSTSSSGSARGVAC